MFSLTHDAMDVAALREQIAVPEAGGFVFFEGRVRNHHLDRPVAFLSYEAYEPMALREGDAILTEVRERFTVRQAWAQHRLGTLQVGEAAVWIGVCADHRREAFLACEAIIDAIKRRVPIWKKEHYPDGTCDWVQCHHEAISVDSPHAEAKCGV